MKNLISYGQHYLEDAALFQKLIESASITDQDNVVEIGAGDGRLTVQLAKKAQSVIAYEIDNQTEEILSKRIETLNNVEIIFENFLKVKLPEKANKIVASLPYQITEPFIEKIKEYNLDLIALIVGSTFANSAVSNSFMGKLWLLTRCYYRVTKICDIPPESFSPPPKTWSSIVVLLPITKEELVQTPAFFVMREIFEQRDKKLKNALREAIIRLCDMRSVFMSKRECERLISTYVSSLENSNMVLEQMNNQQLETLFTFLRTID